MTAVMIFADFNEPGAMPPPPTCEPESRPSIDPMASLMQEAWTEGYLAGRQEPVAEDPVAHMLARLMTSLHNIGVETDVATETASVAVAGLVVDAVIAVAADEWSATLPGRIRALAERIKPALTVSPEFLLLDTAGTERRFADIATLVQTLSDGVTGQDVTIKWQRGQATTSRSALLEDLRDAVRPLSAGLVNEHTVRDLS